MIGVHDLAAALIVADLAGGDDRLADLECLFEPLTIGVEIGECDEAGVVAHRLVLALILRGHAKPVEPA